MSIMMVLVQEPVLSRASRRFGDRALVVGGSLILAVGFAGFMFRTTAGIYSATALMALGNGLTWPSLLGTPKAAPSEIQGAVQGFAGSAGAVASIVGLLLGGLVYGVLGEGVFLLAGIMTALVFVGSLSIPRDRRYAPAT